MSVDVCGLYIFVLLHAFFEDVSEERRCESSFFLNTCCNLLIIIYDHSNGLYQLISFILRLISDKESAWGTETNAV